LCLGPSGANFSIDALLRRRKQRSELRGADESSVVYSSGATVAIRLMQVHLTLIYAAMLISQLQGAAWWQGTAVWWLMARPDSRMVDLTGLSHMGLAFEYLVNFLTHAIVLYELCFVLLIWNAVARPLLLVIGVGVWVGLALVSGWVSFNLLMLVATLAFLSPEGLRSCGSGKTQQLQAKSTTSTTASGKQVAVAGR
jgi:hypothetical protein